MKQRTEYPLNLLDIDETTFQLGAETHNAETCTPEVFDAWIREYVEEIRNVDTSAWHLHDRWHIINYIIRAGFLTLNERKLERAPVEAETE